MNGHTKGYGENGRFYRFCAAHGLTKGQAAQARGVTDTCLSKWASNNPDVRFATRSEQSAALAAKAAAEYEAGTQC